MSQFNISPLVVVDFRVMVYAIEHHFKTISLNHTRSTQEQWLKAAWAILINRGFTGLPYVDHTVAVVDDSSPYWRTQYLAERGFPEYKGGRKAKSDEWYFIQEIGKQYICHPKSPLHFLSFDGFEADDIAAALVRVKAPRLVMLHTVDSDWSGLVNDGALKSSTLDSLIHETNMIDPTVVWLNTSHWLPRIRDEEGLKTWARKRLRCELDYPAQLWQIKVEEGDKSDNLISGSPIEVIDLLNPPSQHDLLNCPESKTQIEAVAHSYAPNSSLDHLTRAVTWFQSEGFSIPSIDSNQYPVVSQ